MRRDAAAASMGFGDDPARQATPTTGYSGRIVGATWERALRSRVDAEAYGCDVSPRGSGTDATIADASPHIDLSESVRQLTLNQRVRGSSP